MLRQANRSLVAVMTALIIIVFASIGYAKTNKDKRSSKKNSSKPTIAVLYFDYAGNDPDMAVLKKGLANMLITDLVSIEGLEVVERARLQELLGELKLNKGKTIDRRKAVKLGKMAGALYIVVGNYLTYGNKLLIEARLLNTATSIYVGKFKARVLGSPDDFFDLQQQLSLQLQEKLVETLPTLARFAPGKKVAHRRPPRPSSAAANDRPSPPLDKRVHPPAAEEENSNAATGLGSGSIRLPYKLALLYAKALDCKDRGDLKEARSNLQKLIKQAPGFTLARSDLEKLK